MCGDCGASRDLVQLEDLANIEFGSYPQQLVGDLLRFYRVDKRVLRVNIDAADMVIELRQALPLGLILNELVTNALKHAFPDGRSGNLEVKLKYFRMLGTLARGELDEGFAQLTVRDDGVGFPSKLNIDETPSMGSHLVRLLTDQLRGELEVVNAKGTAVTLKFPLSPGRLFRRSVQGTHRDRAVQSTRHVYSDGLV